MTTRFFIPDLVAVPRLPGRFIAIIGSIADVVYKAP